MSIDQDLPKQKSTVTSTPEQVQRARAYLRILGVENDSQRQQEVFRDAINRAVTNEELIENGRQLYENYRQALNQTDKKSQKAVEDFNFFLLPNDTVEFFRLDQSGISTVRNDSNPQDDETAVSYYQEIVTKQEYAINRLATDIGIIQASLDNHDYKTASIALCRNTDLSLYPEIFSRFETQLTQDLNNADFLRTLTDHFGPTWYGTTDALSIDLIVANDRDGRPSHDIAKHFKALRPIAQGMHISRGIQDSQSDRGLRGSFQNEIRFYPNNNQNPVAYATELKAFITNENFKNLSEENQQLALGVLVGLYVDLKTNQNYSSNPTFLEQIDEIGQAVFSIYPNDETDPTNQAIRNIPQTLK